MPSFFVCISNCQAYNRDTQASYHIPHHPADPTDDLIGLYAQLPADQQRRLRQLAVFPATFDPAAAAATWELEEAPTSDSLGELLLGGWLSRDAATNRYRLTEPARALALAELSPLEQSTAEERHAAHYLSVLAAANAWYVQGGEAVARGLALFDLEASNILAGEAWASTHAGQDDHAARLACDYAGSEMFHKRQPPRERIARLEVALAAARKLLDREAESRILFSLGRACLDLGEPQRALEYIEQALQIARERGDRRGEGVALARLGLAHGQLGQPRRALELLDQAVPILREVGHRRGEGAALNNLVLVHRSDTHGQAAA